MVIITLLIHFVTTQQYPYFIDWSQYIRAVEENITTLDQSYRYTLGNMGVDDPQIHGYCIGVTY